jgi:hypothetical protein
MQARRHETLSHFRQSVQETDGKNVQSVVKRSLIDGMESVQRRISTDSDDLAALVAALKPLYATLSDQQKIIADEIFRPGPSGHHEFGPPGTEMPMIDHEAMRPPFGRDCEGGAPP